MKTEYCPVQKRKSSIRDLGFLSLRDLGFLSLSFKLKRLRFLKLKLRFLKLRERWIGVVWGE